ncbi:cell wall-associated NlpC family hydrolase [Altererythrobacter atlanticus]|uniref:Uncharacterized protein n=1 Tax=Croceibacterium atlanticum TaxID=1267766 RepID=A0A0F7KSU2_9SPHN|nr:NlpC/P60 family protein [Croceibacterium atlanticum]AKH43478.1 hypothetical protein WYH_02448 [Croceibacterium atlanticum]MBB5731814.1 cell wall-associated NlpC family hydrolase [Croceibacterium atlanticum]
MTAQSIALARAAEALVGTPFRPGGRHVLTGLDCFGLVAAALSSIGREAPTLPIRRLKQPSFLQFLPLATMAGLAETDDAIAPGDVLLSSPGPAQFHLLIADSKGGFIHAHAGLRRVVQTSSPLPWPILRQWRLTENG